MSMLHKIFPTDSLSVPLTRRVLRHMLLELAHLHKRGVTRQYDRNHSYDMHGDRRKVADLKGDNIMMNLGDDLKTLLSNDPLHVDTRLSKAGASNQSSCFSTPVTTFCVPSALWTSAVVIDHFL